MNWASSARRLCPKHLIHALRIPRSGKNTAVRVTPTLRLASEPFCGRRIQPCVHTRPLRAAICLCGQRSVSRGHGGEHRIQRHGGRLNAPCERAFLRRSHDQRAKQQQKQPDHRRDSKRLPHSKPSPALRAFSMTHMRIISAAARHVKCRNGVRNGFRRYWRLFQKKAGQMRRPLL